MDKMKKMSRRFGAAVLLFILVGCSGLPSIGRKPTDAPSPMPSPPTACMGWDCTLRGVIYVGEAAPGNELEGAKVNLAHHSNCSPTEGEYEEITDSDGEFAFDVYVHDTDFIKFEIQAEGYISETLSFGGFDCLYCSCDNMEIVLQQLGEETK